jgi:hypothetical protein
MHTIATKMKTRLNMPTRHHYRRQYAYIRRDDLD